MCDTCNNAIDFRKTISDHRLQIDRRAISVLQINMGKRCNQSCQHCHVGAGPDGKENMDRDTADRIIDVAKNTLGIETIDITGGAPELNPNFRRLVSTFRNMDLDVIDRCNLTVFYEAGQEDLMDFLAENQVRIIASMPCYLEENVDHQRGNTVYEKSIKALKALNEKGYGMDGTGLKLDLVYNPGGAFLPPSQKALEADYKKNLAEAHGIHFNELLTITNMPIKRFAECLKREGKLESYFGMLASKFNSEAADQVMCRELISIGWDGRIYDCDFNQALELPLASRQTINTIESFNEIQSEISVANHCYGCTAGFGSSCKGALA